MSNSTPQNEDRGPNDAQRRNVRDRQIALVIGALMLALYLRTLAPGLLAGDPGEFQFAAWQLGLSHPTGYPLYLLMGHLWQKLLTQVGFSPAVAMNSLSALFGSIAVALTYLVQLNWLIGPKTLKRIAALLSALMFGLNPTAWNQSLIAEVYSLHMLFVVSIILVAQLLARRIDKVAARTAYRWLLGLCFLLGLSMTHHAMMIWLIPGLILYLFKEWHVSERRVTSAIEKKPSITLRNALKIGFPILAAALPLLLYAYIPLRSGPAASPWLHQAIGTEVLTLYQNSWTGFLQYISGQSISVAMRPVGDAIAQVGFAVQQWRLHFTWPGLLLIALGLTYLVRLKSWDALYLTVPYLVLQQGFNLFYGIDDIHAYYIPLFWIGSIWAGFGAAGLGNWMQKGLERQLSGHSGQHSGAEETVTTGLREITPLSQHQDSVSRGVAALVIVLFLIPLRIAGQYYPQIDQSENRGTRIRWEEIMAAPPPEDAILISNDRNEIVPLFYLQTVEVRGIAMSGLFPLIRPTADFANIGATAATALALESLRPIYLIKAMPGLETRFQLAAGPPPLVRVLGEWHTVQAQTELVVQYGPFTLVGFDWLYETDLTARIRFYWQVDSAVDKNYASTVQLFADSGEKIAQHDHLVGGSYYPTSLWQPGERLADLHELELPDDSQAVEMLVGMYDGTTIELIGKPIEIRLD